MLILLISTTLSVAMPAANQETINFFGKIPTPSCNLDKSIHIENESKAQKIKCPDNKNVVIKKENILLNNIAMQNVWVIEYGK